MISVGRCGGGVRDGAEALTEMCWSKKGGSGLGCQMGGRMRIQCEGSRDDVLSTRRSTAFLLIHGLVVVSSEQRPGFTGKNEAAPHCVHSATSPEQDTIPETRIVEYEIGISGVSSS